MEGNSSNQVAKKDVNSNQPAAGIVYSILPTTMDQAKVGSQSSTVYGNS